MLTGNLLRNRTSELFDSERSVLESYISDIRKFPAGEVIVQQGKEVNVSTLLVEGFMTRRIDAPDGRRHLVAIHVPGDFVDLHAYALKQLDHDVGALTDVRCAIFSHEAIAHIQESNVALTRRLWMSTLLDAAMHRQWIYRLANLNAVQRVGHFLCETNARLLAIGASCGHNFQLPMTQGEIGEVCGLTNVHVNRVLRTLREQEMCELRSSQVHIKNLKRLVENSMFDASYLYLNNKISKMAQA